MISRLHKGRCDEFVALIQRYFSQGMERLAENQQQVAPVAEQLLAVLDDEAGKTAVASLVDSWGGLETLQQAWADYQKQHSDKASVDKKNRAQQALRATFEPFFSALHDNLKQIDKAVRRHEKNLADAAQQAGKRQSTDRATRQLKAALEELHKEVKNAESSFAHIHWLQTRFPKAEYEDVTGLCKLASLEEVKEQDYSLNPGRYVGVVIEEDGKTEEEFIAYLAEFGDQLMLLDGEARTTTEVIRRNLAAIVGEV